MFCDKCGNKVTKNSAFCDRCGHSFAEESKSRPNQLRSYATSFLKNIDIRKILNRHSLVVVGIILAVAISGGISSFYKNYQAQIQTSSQEFTKLQEQLERSRTSTIESLSKLEEENKKLKSESKELKSTIQSVSSAAQKEQMSSNSGTLSQDFLNKIMPRIVKVRCYKSGSVSEGSGTIQAPASGSTQWEVYTNLHVVGANSACTVSLPQGPDFLPTKTYPITLSRFGSYYPDIDFAVLKVSGATEFFNQFPLLVCGVADIKIGDRVTVFGYPSFGGDSLTVTDGIVSGIEYTAYGPIYKTSAKIDRGNSGGLAVDNNNKCSIGIPTWATSGSFDGLGYIQSWDMIIKSGNL